MTTNKSPHTSKLQRDYTTGVILHQITRRGNQQLKK